MASSHKLKDPNGDRSMSVQDKSIDVKMPNQGIESPANETLTEQFVSHSEIPKELIDTPIPPVPTIEIGSMQLQGLRSGVRFDFDDITLIPKAQTNIRSRYEGNLINPYHKTDFGWDQDVLPLFTAPMDTVVSLHNAYQFSQNKIGVVLPRTSNKNMINGTFTSYGLNEIPDFTDVKHVLLDIANGHMSMVLEWCVKVKKKYPQVKIMAGNIANPQTYQVYCDSGIIDYARVGIGNGNGCLTTQQTGVGYPMASLIAECNAIKQKHKNPVKIVADGGMKKYSDIIKALALGADYVMVGSMFTKALESSGQNYWRGIKINPTIAKFLYERGFTIKKEFRGMSTKGAQRALGNKVLKTSEGVVRRLTVEYTLEQWTKNFEDYLRSTMSYCNANSLRNFVGKVDYTLITTNAFNRFNK